MMVEDCEDYLNVVCFYWKGDRWKSGDMGPEYVNRLYRGVKRNLSLPHRFICFTNEPIRDQLEKGICVWGFEFPSTAGTGVLPRVFMFSLNSGLVPGTRVLALDLDVVITGPLDDIGSYTGEFCVRSKFAPGQHYKADGDIIGFRPSRRLERLFWRDFISDYSSNLKRTGGRERYWFRHVMVNHFDGGDCDRWQDLYPGQIISYKRHVKKSGKLPNGARIVSCHGNPRPHQIREQWVKANWK